MIIDEKKGKQITQELGLQIIGLLGVLLKAKNTGLLKQIKPILSNLEGVGFRMSEELKLQILNKLDELNKLHF